MGENNTDFCGTLFDRRPTSTSRIRATMRPMSRKAGLGLPDRDYYLQPALHAAEGEVPGLCRNASAPHRVARSDAHAEEIVALETRTRTGELDQGQSSATSSPPTIPCRSPQLETLAPGFAVADLLCRGPSWATRRASSLPRKRLPETGRHLRRKHRSGRCRHGGVQRRRQHRAVPFQGLRRRRIRHAQQDAFRPAGERGRAGSARCARFRRRLHRRRPLRPFGTMGWAVGQLYTAKYFPPDGEGQDRGSRRQCEGGLPRAHAKNSTG